MAGSSEGGWTSVTQGQRIGTYSGGTYGSPVPLNWFVGSAPVWWNNFRIADRTDGMRAPLNQTNIATATWEHDYSVFPWPRTGRDTGTV